MFSFAGSFYFSRFFLSLPAVVRKLVYEVRVVQKVAPSIREKMDSLPPCAKVLDLGANLGMWADYFHCCGMDVLAVEPDPACVKFLEERFCNSNVKILATAVHDKVSQTQLWFHSSRAGFDDLELSQSTSILEEKNDTVLSEFTVNTVPLIELLLEFEPAFVKMDIEGAELDAIIHLLENWNKSYSDLPFFAVEPHHRNIASYNTKYEDLIRLISFKGLDEKFMFDWA